MASCVQAWMRARFSLFRLQLAALENRVRASGLQTELRYGDPDDPIGAVLVISDSFGNRVDLLRWGCRRGLRSPAALFARALRYPLSGENGCVSSEIGDPLRLGDARRAPQTPGETHARIAKGGGRREEPAKPRDLRAPRQSVSRERLGRVPHIAFMDKVVEMYSFKGSTSRSIATEVTKSRAAIRAAKSRDRA